MNEPHAQEIDQRFAQAAEILRRRFGHQDFRPGQADALRSVLAARNLVAVMPTGSGKSLLYQLPALLGDGLTLVVSPLIALMKDQVDDLSSKNIPCTYVNSSLDWEEQRIRLDACGRGEVRLLYVAPERFQNASFMGALRRMKIARMAVDEAHCISQWGHDFRPDYRRLKHWRHELGSPLVTALTATATPEVQRDIVDALGLDPQMTDVHVHGFARTNLMLSVVRAHSEAEKDGFLIDFLRRETGSGIIYAGTRRGADELAARLKSVVPSIASYHAGMEPDQRTRAQDNFLGGKTRVVVATVAFGMGIDKPDVRFVVHYQFPGSVESYYQEIGRAGRDGLASRCTLLYSPADRQLREFFIELNYPDRSAVEIVYNALWLIPDNPIEMTYEEISEHLGGDVKSGQVGAAIRLLDEAGVTRSMSTDAAASVMIHGDPAAVVKQLRGPAQQRMMEALLSTAAVDPDGWRRFSIGRLARDSGLSDDQLRRGLAACDKEGVLDYEPPFRGRGVEKVADSAPPFAKLTIDWARQDKLRRAEEDKLDRMEQFIRTRSCRHGFILEYFGENSDSSCAGACDNCGEAKPRRKGESSEIVAKPKLVHRDEADKMIRLAALKCVAGIRPPVGVLKVAAVITGSNSKWIRRARPGSLPGYAEAPVKQDMAREVVEKMVRQGFFAQDSGTEYPVLEITEKGVAELDRLAETVAAPVIVPAMAAKETPPNPVASILPAVQVELDRLVQLVLVADREQAKAVVDELRLFSSQAILDRLVVKYESARETRQRSRAVWAVGELCSEEACEFLVTCAISSDAEIRALAASALGKIAPSVLASCSRGHAAVQRARDILEKLLQDPAAPVRAHAEKSRALFFGDT